MESKANNIRIDEELKKEAEELYNRLGLSLSTAINIFLKQSIREQELPFELEFNNKTKEALLEAENGKGKTFNSIDEL